MPSDVAELTLKVVSDKVDLATRRLERLERQSKRNSLSNNKLGGSYDKLTRAVGRGVAAFVSFQAVTRSLGGIIKADQDLAKINNRLRFVTGSLEGARKEFEYISQRANFYGQDIRSVAQEYAKLAASTKDTRLEGEETRLIFEGVSSAAATLSLSADEVEGSFKAITQISDKSIVSMEELRQQLGERLTGSFKIAAESMGITRAELDKLVSSGKLAAEEFLPAFARQLIKEFGQNIPEATDTTTAAINRFNNALFSLATEQGGTFAESFRDALTDVTELMKDPAFKTGLAGLIQLAGLSVNALGGIVQDIGVVSTVGNELLRRAGFETGGGRSSGSSPIEIGTGTVKAGEPNLHLREYTKEEQALLKRLETVERTLLTEEELVRASYADQVEVVREAESQKLIARQNAAATITSLESKMAAELEIIERQSNAKKLDQKRAFFGHFSQLALSENKKLASIGKAAAIGEATIDTYKAANKALSAFPPPFNVIAMAGALATGFANVQAIRSQGYNFADGGIVPGSSFNGDRVPANVNSGEMILNRNQQGQLFAMANGGGGGRSVSIQVNNFGVETSVETKKDDQGRDLIVFTNKILQATRSEVANDFGNGGPISRAAEGAYGLRRGG